MQSTTQSTNPTRFSSNEYQPLNVFSMQTMSDKPDDLLVAKILPVTREKKKSSSFILGNLLLDVLKDESLPADSLGANWLTRWHGSSSHAIRSVFRHEGEMLKFGYCWKGRWWWIVSTVVLGRTFHPRFRSSWQFPFPIACTLKTSVVHFHSMTWLRFFDIRCFHSERPLWAFYFRCVERKCDHSRGLIILIRNTDKKCAYFIDREITLFEVRYLH